MPTPSGCGTTSYDIAGSSERVRYPCAIVPPNGDCFAISGSTWMKLWSCVASANAWIISCGTSIHDDGPNSAPTSMVVMPRTLRDPGPLPRAQTEPEPDRVAPRAVRLGEHEGRIAA